MEQTKRRRRPNFFDLLIILVILAAVMVAYFLSHRTASPSTAVVRRTYTVEMPRLAPGIEDYVSVGDPVTDNVKNYAVGTVQDVEVRPCITEVLDEESGTLRQAEVEGYVTLVLIIEADTVETDKTIDTVSGYTLRTGGSVSFTAGSMSASGNILSVSR